MIASAGTPARRSRSVSPDDDVAFAPMSFQQRGELLGLDSLLRRLFGAVRNLSQYRLFSHAHYSSISFPE
jgi:hypothetical protein